MISQCVIFQTVKLSFLHSHCRDSCDRTEAFLGVLNFFIMAVIYEVAPMALCMQLCECSFLTLTKGKQANNLLPLKKEGTEEKPCRKE
jgi:type III secretory pathway component EscT